MIFYIEIDEKEFPFTDFDEAVKFCENRLGIENIDSFEWDEVKEERSFFELECFLDDFYYEGIPDIFCYISYTNN